jgi:serine/threonine protein kinase
LGKYRIERALGQGGAGTVFLAYDSTLERHAAVKLLEDRGDGPAERGRILREARTASALNHPSICSISRAPTSSPPKRSRCATAFVARCPATP